ncbi:hypothetical protein ASG36_18265 [Geodermatophilus sp. Leaf369]|jgi:hypothetical protein|uniref:hypothetical protein n=1 Tax=Geodermatophilus sp. Leaf369 TaxID=1736354 RepID=UPI0006F373A8|nr:hypothetical protein [Geodermatophilus sp. Leaf369]KQS56941.1 hypothetical protein ASG36_18265 [Geodermatophilus sp. Leaf369]QNG35506.1 hypothetical protein F1C76_01785 [Geodermatophilaceae bacterium NBWT11]
MTVTPRELESEVTLVTAANRIDFLSRRDAGVVESTAPADADDFLADLRNTGTTLDRHEALELLALGEVVFRKAHDSRHLGMHAALREGATWADVATALDGDAGQAWDAHQRWIADQTALHLRSGTGGLDDGAAATARTLAGPRP